VGDKETQKKSETSRKQQDPQNRDNPTDLVSQNLSSAASLAIGPSTLDTKPRMTRRKSRKEGR
jgi:hypothetical protein